MSELSLEEARRVKLDYVREHTNPYPERFDKTHEIAEVASLPDGMEEVRTAGRIVLLRKMGKMSFLEISDIMGKIQVAIKKDSIGEEAYEIFKKGYDIGDFIGVIGDIFTTNTGRRRFVHVRFSSLARR